LGNSVTKEYRWASSISPDFAQEVMEDIYLDMTDVEVYTDHIGIFAQSWDHHQKIVAQGQNNDPDLWQRRSTPITIS
jgi:hypothetical protein